MDEKFFDEIDRVVPEFGAIVKRQRKKRGMTQEMLAEISGISEIYLRQLEKGRSTASWVIWLKICTALEIDIDDIQQRFILPKISEVRSLLNMQ